MISLIQNLFTSKETKELLLKSEQGDTQAQYDLACKYYQKKNKYNEALQWYSKAAENGHVQAQLVLGNIYCTKKILKQAIHWYQKAANQGSAEAQYKLALN